MQVNSKNIADIFKLPCVRSIEKADDDGGFFVKTFSKYSIEDGELVKRYFVAGENDWLCQLDDGKWRALSDKEYRSWKEANDLFGEC